MDKTMKAYIAYSNAIFNLQNWVHVIERGKLSRNKEIEVLNNALSYFRKAHEQLREIVDAQQPCVNNEH